MNLDRYGGARAWEAYEFDRERAEQAELAELQGEDPGCFGCCSFDPCIDDEDELGFCRRGFGVVNGFKPDCGYEDYGFPPIIAQQATIEGYMGEAS